MKNLSDIKIGILGGGQLGKMLYQEATKHDLNLHFLEMDDSFPASKICTNLTKGDFKNYDDVLAFGKNMDVITIEIEAVNTDALIELEKMGKKVFPQPHLVELIKDKGDQKSFYQKRGLVTSPFKLFPDKTSILEAITNGNIEFPFVQKSRRDGYDGRGVAVIKSKEDIGRLMDTPSVIEDLVNIKKELGVIVSRDQEGNIKSFPPVEMAFHPTANLVEYLFSPSLLQNEILDKAVQLAERVINEMQLIGLLAVELFVDNNDQILINEVAPRPHNSGHQTIEANYTSQYGQLLRILTGMPLGDTAMICPSVMVNVLGEPNYTGDVQYKNLDKVLEVSGAHVHLYGKTTTKPFRKMGHITVLDQDLDSAIQKANFAKETLKVIA